MDGNLRKVCHAALAALMVQQKIFLQYQAEDVEDLIHFHNDHQILFHQEVDGEKDEKESPGTGDLPPYWLPSEPRMGPLCEGQLKGGSDEEN